MFWRLPPEGSTPCSEAQGVEVSCPTLAEVNPPQAEASLVDDALDIEGESEMEQAGLSSQAIARGNVATERAVRTRGDGREGTTRGEPPTAVAVRVSNFSQGEGSGRHKGSQAQKMRWSSLGPTASDATCNTAEENFHGHVEEEVVDDSPMEATPAKTKPPPDGKIHAATLTDTQRMVLKSIRKAEDDNDFEKASFLNRSLRNI